MRRRRYRRGGRHPPVARLAAPAHVLLAEFDATLVVCDARTLTDVDLASVDALARLALAARRRGRRVRVRHAPEALRQLLDLAGLADVVPCVD